VSAFGFSGTNAHVVLEEAPINRSDPAPLTKQHGVPILISGKKPEMIAAQADRLRQHWDAHPEFALEDVARSAALTRTQFEERAVIVASNRASALEALGQMSEGVVADNALRGPARSRAEVVAVFPGSVNGVAEVCRAMHDSFAPFRDSFDSAARVFNLELNRPLQQVVLEPNGTMLLEQQTYAQPALFAFQIALFRLFEAWGLRFSAVLGVSAGELAAAHVSGALSLEDACRVIAARGRLSQSMRCVSNSLACDGAAVNLDGLMRAMQTLKTRSTVLRWISTVTGSTATGEILAASSYWIEHVRGPKRFMDAVRTLESEDTTMFLELGPAAEFSERGPSWLPALNLTNSQSVEDSVISALSALHVRGVDVDWTRFFEHIGGRRVDLPTYPFRAKRHWITPSTPQIQQQPVPSERPSAVAAIDPSWSYRREWIRLERSAQNVESTGRLLFLGSHEPHRRGLEALGHATRATFACNPSDPEAIAALASDELQAVVFFANSEPDSTAAASEANAIEAIAALAAVKDTHARVFWVTQDCWSVSDVNASGAIGQAALWGLGLSCSMEHADRWGGLIDLPSGPMNRASAERLLETISSSDNERQVAIRDGATYVARLVRLPIAANTELHALRTDVAYLVTGGLGGLGLRIAIWLADRGARHLVLIGRTALPERRRWKDLASSRQANAVQMLRDLELRGVNVQTAAFDVADASAWSQWVSLYRDEQRPPIRGVVHAAGVLEGGAATDLTELEITRHLSPKLEGALALDRALRGEPLDFFVMFSSASALVPSPQLGAYAGANACLDALAERRRAAGQPALSVAWGPFAEAGMLVDAAREAGRLLQVMEPMKPEEAFDLMGRLWNGPPCAAVLPIDWERWRARYRGLLANPLFERFQVETPKDARSGESPTNVEGFLTTLFSDVLGSTEEIDPDESLVALGLDSLMAYDAQSSIEKLWKVEVPVTLLLKGASVRDVAELVHLGVRRSGELPAPEWTVLPTMVEFPAKDGLMLYGHLSLPEGPGPCPAVVVHTGDQGGALDERGRYIQLFEHAPLLSAGMAVLTVDQRGTPGHGKEYRKMADLGGNDVDDVLAAAQYLSGRPEIDASRICFLGTSRGAYAGLLAVQRAPEVFRAAVLRMGFYQPLEYVRGEKELRPATSPLREIFASWEAAAEFMSASQRNPLTHIAKVKTPLMVVHGDSDRIVSIAQARRLEQVAKDAGVDVHLRVVPKMGHDLFELAPSWPSVWEEILVFLTERVESRVLI
jgi:NAD(P)-dependent dehydrogenase (short-subunit alcohol dehydrogenase family)/alpha-beta hydrolase superfamily lysophospholipase/acyl carrier protein